MAVLLRYLNLLIEVDRQSDEDIDKVMTEINKFRSGVSNSYLKNLLDSFFDDKVFVEKFRLAPAAKRAHHAYLGGLAVHTLHILKLMANNIRYTT
jgi:3'-5' exoribonuclease